MIQVPGDICLDNNSSNNHSSDVFLLSMVCYYMFNILIY